MSDAGTNGDSLHCHVGLKTGYHYWYRHKREMIWRICYIGIDPDDNQWLHRIGSPASQLSDIDLGCFDWKLISEPNAGLHRTSEARHN